MRLREVRMSNINFLCYPGFAETTRFEHSIGTCYLASLAARKLGTPPRDTMTLMAAALYHDVATPPFAHATEDVFTEHFGFNHEDKLFEILSGKHTASTVATGQYAPIFLGRRAILQRVCQSPTFRRLGIDPLEVAGVAHGEGVLGQLISGDIDLDNLDNVVRAALNMGLRPALNIGVRLAMAFAIEGNLVRMSPDSLEDIVAWQKLRWRVYDGIFTDFRDFALQSMLKLAIVRAIEDGSIVADHWNCTDNELLHEHLMRSPEASSIVERMRLGDLFEPLAVVATRQPEAKKRVLCRSQRKELEARMEQWLGTQCVVNYYVDKRGRSLHNLPGSEGAQPIGSATDDNLIVGVFTPSKKALSRTRRTEFKQFLGRLLGAEINDMRETHRGSDATKAVQRPLGIGA